MLLFCPRIDYADKELTDKCPVCGREYQFPLIYPPHSIKEYRNITSLGRGFYGAVFYAEHGNLGSPCVIKISPVDIYSFFNKDFEKECRQHLEASRGASHIISINNADTLDVTFSDNQPTTIKCHISELQYIRGELLSNYLKTNKHLSAMTLCQIAIDLLRIRQEFEQKLKNHNDLHADNILVCTLPNDQRRANAFDDLIRVYALDLGSVSDGSTSNAGQLKFGDLHWIAKHIDILIDKLLINPDKVEDSENRIALALQTVLNRLISSPENNRGDIQDQIDQIEKAIIRAKSPWYPWRDNFTLKNFGEHYNAQTLSPWHVPNLLVDPDSKWIPQVSQAGPQIITGMRGCGKTLILRSLEFHARLSKHHNESGSNDECLTKIKTDNYIGLLVSAQRLLDIRQDSLAKTSQRLTRLFIYFSLQAVRAAQHLKDIFPDQININAHKILSNSIDELIIEDTNLINSNSLDELEANLLRLTIKATRNISSYSVHGSASDVFTHFSDHLRQCSPLWSSAQVFYLLDDVSTRYLTIEKVGDLLSTCLFQSPSCAFKLTSEWQTIQLGLRSPGKIHPIRIGRDIQLFDLGAEVYETIRNKTTGLPFVQNILQHRSNYCISHPTKILPKDLLGDVPLITIASDIARSTKTGRSRKDAYRGLSCLAHVCVGDIGDIIQLYYEILKKWDGVKSPVPASDQSNSFQDFSSRRLYDLNRRASSLKLHATSFAEASHSLLVKSYKEFKEMRKKDALATWRDRQYTSIYVRVTLKEELKKEKQVDHLRELIDAGVFVFSGGSARTKTRDKDQFLQFKLAYRKIYGLANYIGISDRDRFELSGIDLEEWLEEPEKGKAILLRNLGSDDNDSPKPENTDSDLDKITQNGQRIDKIQPIQLNLFATNSAPSVSTENIHLEKLEKINHPIRFEMIGAARLSKIRFDSILVGLGFEERTYKSNEHLCKYTTPKNVYAIKYNRDGFSTQISDLWKNTQCIFHEVSYNESFLKTNWDIGKTAIIDISGLAKPIIFLSIRSQLILHGEIYICYASANNNYPLQSDLESILVAERSQNPYLLLERLGNVLKGEEGPYEPIKLLQDDYDETRNRSLLAFSSPKHERLFSLLDYRDYDQIEIITSSKKTPRAKVSRLVSDVLAKNNPNTHIIEQDTDDLDKLVLNMDASYLRLYEQLGSNFDIGLTGSKIQAVASATLAAKRKISQAWYVKPSDFDEKRFSTGFKSLKIFKISLL